MRIISFVVISCLLLSACATSQGNKKYVNWLSDVPSSCKADQDPNALLDSLESARVEIREANTLVETKERKWWQVWKPKVYHTKNVLNSYGQLALVSADGCPGRMFLNSDGQVVLKCVGLQGGKEYCKILQKRNGKYVWEKGHASTLGISFVGASINGTGCDSGPIKVNIAGNCKWSSSASAAGMMLSISGDNGQVFKVLLKDPNHKGWSFNEDPER